MRFRKGDDDPLDAEIQAEARRMVEERRLVAEKQRIEARLKQLAGGNGSAAGEGLPIAPEAGIRYDTPEEQSPFDDTLKDPKTKKKKGFGMKKKQKEEPPTYYHVMDDTLNANVTKMLPKSEKLQFIDPKALELPIKAVPRLKIVIENMSRPIKKNPIPIVTLAIVGVISIIGVSIFYSQVIEPAVEADRQYQLDWQRQCQMNATACATPPPRPSGGNFFEFKPINPFEPPPLG